MAVQLLFEFLPSLYLSVADCDRPQLLSLIPLLIFFLSNNSYVLYVDLKYCMKIESCARLQGRTTCFSPSQLQCRVFFKVPLKLFQNQLTMLLPRYLDIQLILMFEFSLPFSILREKLLCQGKKKLIMINIFIFKVPSIFHCLWFYMNEGYVCFSAFN